MANPDPPIAPHWELLDQDDRGIMKALHSLIRTHTRHDHYRKHSIYSLKDGMKQKDFVRINAQNSERRWRRMLYRSRTNQNFHAFVFARRGEIIPGGTTTNPRRHVRYCCTVGISEGFGTSSTYVSDTLTELNELCWQLYNGGYTGFNADGTACLPEMLSTVRPEVDPLDPLNPSPLGTRYYCPSEDNEMKTLWAEAYNQNLITYDAALPSNEYLDPRYAPDDPQATIYRWYIHPHA